VESEIDTSPVGQVTSADDRFLRRRKLTPATPWGRHSLRMWKLRATIGAAVVLHVVGAVQAPFLWGLVGTEEAAMNSWPGYHPSPPRVGVGDRPTRGLWYLDGCLDRS
jgi:hypothetical protein